MTCIRCKKNEQSPGAEPYCGSCWAKNPDSSTMDWPSYSESAVAMLVTGKRCRKCYRQLYALPGDNKQANICTDCYE